MADITDPNAVKFCNEEVRPICDKIMQFYWFAKALKVQWTAQGLAALIPNDTSLVADGSDRDGRTKITGQDVLAVLGNLDSFLTSLEANSNLKLNQFAKVAVNIQP